MSGSIDDDLSESGVAMVGTIDSGLVEKIEGQIASPKIEQKNNRQTRVRWNSDCDAVVGDFETKLKPKIAALESKVCLKHAFVIFHEFPTTGIYRAGGGTGKHLVVIVIREGPGFPRIYAGSHKSDESDLSAFGSPSIGPTAKCSVTVFNGNVMLEDPAVLGVGGAGILLLY